MGRAGINSLFTLGTCSPFALPKLQQKLEGGQGLPGEKLPRLCRELAMATSLPLRDASLGAHLDWSCHVAVGNASASTGSEMSFWEIWILIQLFLRSLSHSLICLFLWHETPVALSHLGCISGVSPDA